MQKWLEKVVSVERRNGLETRLGFQKIKVDGKRYKWDDRKEEVREINFRGKGKLEGD